MTKAKPRAKAKAKPRTKAKAKPRTKAKAKTRTTAKTETRAKAKAKPRTKAKAKSRTKAKAKASSKGDAAASELISRYIAKHTDWRGQTLARIRNAFHDADPAIVEEWKWMGSPVFSHDGLVAVANAHKGKVKVTFYQGARLPDPHAVFNAGLGGNQWRAIDLYEGDEIDESAFRELVRSAVSYNQSRGK